jgi:hypothetical protein
MKKERKLERYNVGKKENGKKEKLERKKERK